MNGSWPDAEEVCQTLHSTLATVQRQHEQRFLKAFLKSRHVSDHPDYAYWIDGNDFEVDRKWQWPSIGKPLNYTEWGPGEPTNGADEECILLWGPSRFRMGDYECYRRQRFICQQRNPVIPASSSGWVALG